jgi:hypothetical protein
MASNRSWEPRAYPVRDPRSTQQQVGKIVNPPRTMKLGGKGEASLIDTEQKQKGTMGPTGKGPVSDRGGRGR